MGKITTLAATASLMLFSAAHAGEGPRRTFTFVAPADGDARADEFACGIRFGMRQVIDNVQGGRYGEVRRASETSAELTTFVGSQDFNVGKGVRHVLSVEVKRDGQQCAMSLQILSSESFKKGLINLWQPPEFTAADILVQTHKVLYRPTFTSEFPAASLMANFDRLAVKGCTDVGYSSGNEIPRDLRNGIDDVYCVKTASGYVPVVPECAPYRNGSRCTVLAHLRTERLGDTFDARPAAQELRVAVEAVLKD